MSRTRVIYFLSAIVLIIGCFALNQSYSMFVQTESKDVVSSTVPTIEEEVTLSTESVEVEGNKEYLIKQTITNNNSIPTAYRITANSDSETVVVESTKYEEEIYLSYGVVGANTTKDIYFKVSNTSEDTTNVAIINFTLDYNYATLKMNTEEYLASANINNETQYEITLPEATVPYSDNTNTLNYKLMEKQMTKFDTEVEELTLNYLYKNNNKVELPISSLTELLVTELTEVTDVETNDVGLYKAEDDYGLSYYYRGANNYNYVDFAGFIWRIVRINGDGSVRIILDGGLDKIKHKDELDFVYKNSALYALDTDGLVQFNSLYNDNAYIGYMYGDFETNSTSYDDAHENIKSSTIKTYLETFYQEYLLSYQNDFIADTIFCGDKTRASGFTDKGFGNVTTYYSTRSRLFENIEYEYPTLECAKKELIADNELTEEQLAYSRYTSIIDESIITTKRVLINNDLTYPIGLLSADELVIAGAFRGKVNQNYYLYDAFSSNKINAIWRTLSPSLYISGVNTYFFDSSLPGYSLSNNTNDALHISVRPVINLKANLLVDDGDGSQGTPYTVKVS